MFTLLFLISMYLIISGRQQTMAFRPIVFENILKNFKLLINQGHNCVHTAGVVIGLWQIKL